MSLKTTEFDPAEYLSDKESIIAYLTEALEHEDARGVADALADVVRARGGVGNLARETSLPEEVILRAVKETGAADLEAMLQVTCALDVRSSTSLVA